jgi:hypothetical protein
LEKLNQIKTTPNLNYRELEVVIWVKLSLVKK